MQVQALIKAVQDRLQEPALEGILILGWMDEAQNRIGLRAGAVFPKFLNPDGTQSALTEPVFDNRYHELLVIYACARYRESDEAMNEAQYIDNLFEHRLSEATVYIQVPTIYQDNPFAQQFIAIANQTDFQITKPNFFPHLNYLQVYLNGTPQKRSVDYRLDGNTVKLSVPTMLGDQVSCTWEEAEPYNIPPRTWGGW
jgi:hypothetical protein